jgi:hypothetical protein
MKKIIATALLALACPALAAAASLNPLDGNTSLDAPLDLSNADPTPALHDTVTKPKDRQEFVDGNIFQGNPLSGMLPENQWAAPKATYAGPLLQRR